MTLFPAVGLIRRGEGDRVLRNQKFIKKCKKDYQRILGQVDWKGKEIDPFWPEYPEQLAQAIESGWKLGLRTQLTMFGGDCRDVIGAAKIMYGVLESRRDRIMMIEAVNEGNLHSIDAIAVAKIMAPLGLPFGVGLGDQGIDEINECGEQCGATVSYYHTSRTLGDKSESGGPMSRIVRQCWDFKELRGCRVDNEPPGIASSSSQVNDPFVLATKRAADIICGGSAFCLHAGAGVFLEYMTGSYGVRQANLDEVPGLLEMAEAVDHATDHLPLGIEEWAPFNTNQPVKVITGRVNKLYGSRNGPQFAEIAIGCEGPHTIQAKEACYLRVCNPATGEVLVDRHFAKDETGPMAGLWSYVLIGTQG